MRTGNFIRRARILASRETAFLSGTARSTLPPCKFPAPFDSAEREPETGRDFSARSILWNRLRSSGFVRVSAAAIPAHRAIRRDAECEATRYPAAREAV